MELESLSVLKCAARMEHLTLKLFQEEQHGRNQMLQHCVLWWTASALEMFELFENVSLDWRLDLFKCLKRCSAIGSCFCSRVKMRNTVGTSLRKCRTCPPRFLRSFRRFVKNSSVSQGALHNEKLVLTCCSSQLSATVCGHVVSG